MSELADREARRRILTEFGSTFFVEAAAGTGKTTALVGRIVRLISATTMESHRISGSGSLKGARA
jgi:ATP-dependent exoDNAse (exonuclease V) beta subunit